MTPLTKPVRRTARGMRRGIVIELEPPNLITLREKGRRYRVTTTAEVLYVLLVKQDVETRRAVRRKNRKRGRR